MKGVSARARAMPYSVMLITAVAAATSQGLAVSQEQDDAARSGVRNCVYGCAVGRWSRSGRPT
jgi:hypothetical protein